MESEERPNPEDLLRAVTREEDKVKRGRLKVFLGMAAGVGKTYAMLNDAHQLKLEGVDLVVGIVNTHGREETAKLVMGLELLPAKMIEYRGYKFEELDLEAVLARKPQHVLVDELAHTNIPGSRHLKRWQDVVEILDNGIDVSTTINVQHIESLKDVVETITGVPIRETVPDSILESATFIEVIDLTPVDLLQRLKEGKVYLGEQAEVARAHFFQEDRLTALREIALRFAAEKVDHDLRGMVSTVERGAEWKPRERLLVAISHSPHSQKLIRSARRLAFTLNAPWIAVHVDDGTSLDEAERTMLAKNIDLARELGAEVVTTQDPDIATAIERIARQKQVTQIIVGRPPEKWFSGFFSPASLLDRLAARVKEVDVHVIRQSPIPGGYRRKRKMQEIEDFSHYFAIFCVVIAIALLCKVIVPWTGYRVVGVLFLLGILLSSLFFRKGQVFFGAILYGLIWDYFFIPPAQTFNVGVNEDMVILGLYVLTAIVTGVLTDRARVRKEMLIKRETSAEALYEIVRQIATLPSSKEIVHSIKKHLEVILHGHVEFVFKPLNTGLVFDEKSELVSSPKERGCALWVFENNKEAGWSTTTLPMSLNLYIPLKGYREMVGVLAYRPAKGQLLSSEEKSFLYTSGQQLAYYIERRFSEELERQVEERKRIENIYKQIYRNYPFEEIQLPD